MTLKAFHESSMLYDLNLFHVSNAAVKNCFAQNIVNGGQLRFLPLSILPHLEFFVIRKLLALNLIIMISLFSNGQVAYRRNFELGIVNKTHHHNWKKHLKK